MAGLRDIKLRINSVNSTMQITKAMNLIATVKLKKARDRMEDIGKYSEELEMLIKEVAFELKGQNYYIKPSKESRVLYIVFTSDRGLCGSYNTNVIKKAVSMMDEKSDKVITIGSKSSHFFHKRGYNILKSYDNAIEKYEVDSIVEIGEMILNEYDSGAVSAVQLVYTQFLSTMNFNVINEKLLPIDIPLNKNKELTYTFEPSPEAVFKILIPNYIKGRLYYALANALGSENSSRMLAMSAATESASNMIDELTAHYNRARQATITNELSEIVGGTEALK